MRLKVICLVALIVSIALLFIYFYCLIHDLNVFPQSDAEDIAWATVCWAIQVVAAIMWMITYNNSDKNFYVLCLLQAIYIAFSSVLVVVQIVDGCSSSIDFSRALLFTFTSCKYGIYWQRPCALRPLLNLSRC